MASGEPTQDAPGLNATRQMLDELDALMERMLALPINETEQAPAPPIAPISPAAPSAPPMAAKLALLQVPVEDPPLDPAHAGTNPSHLPTLNAVRTEARPTIPLPPLPHAPAIAPTPLSDRILPPVVQPKVDNALDDVPEPDDTAASWFIAWLLWGNRAFDRATLSFGERGEWLRSPSGRSMLGATGLMLVAAALLWLLHDWLGWTW